jgi:pyruvate dehydrogenase complex dehydrogenase (E1) component
LEEYFQQCDWLIIKTWWGGEGDYLLNKKNTIGEMVKIVRHDDHRMLVDTQ